MSFLKLENIELVGLSSSIPKHYKDNLEDPLVADGAKILKNVGIQKRYLASESQCASDLCEDAARRLLEDLSWKPEEVDILVFVTQSPDHILPSTAPLLQDRLGLSKDTYVLEVSKGCSGYVYGLSVIASLMQTGFLKKGLLLAGDTISKTCSTEDKSTYPLFGDAGTATALSYHKGYSPMFFHFGTDGSGKDAILIKDGGSRHPYTPKSSERVEQGEGIKRANRELRLDGMDVFSFGISTAPKTVKALFSEFELDWEATDAFVFHQANKFMNEKIRKKLKLPAEKVPYSLQEYANTSSATIPLTMISQMSQVLSEESQKIVACGFGVGLSWATVFFETQKVITSSIAKI